MAGDEWRERAELRFFEERLDAADAHAAELDALYRRAALLHSRAQLVQRKPVTHNVRIVVVQSGQTSTRCERALEALDVRVKRRRHVRAWGCDQHAVKLLLARERRKLARFEEARASDVQDELWLLPWRDDPPPCACDLRALADREAWELIGRATENDGIHGR